MILIATGKGPSRGYSEEQRHGEVKHLAQDHISSKWRIRTLTQASGLRACALYYMHGCLQQRWQEVEIIPSGAFFFLQRVYRNMGSNMIESLKRLQEIQGQQRRLEITIVGNRKFYDQEFIKLPDNNKGSIKQEASILGVPVCTDA